jgi:hypothetical protein
MFLKACSNMKTLSTRVRRRIPFLLLYSLAFLPANAAGGILGWVEWEQMADG